MKTISTVLFVSLLASFGLAQQRWTKTYGGPGDDEAAFVRQTTDGGYIVAGEASSFGAGARDVWLVKTDSSGDTLWTRTCGGASDDEAYAVEQTSDGYIIAGYTISFGAGQKDVYLVKTNTSGDTLWTRTYGGGSPDGGNFVRQTSDGGYIVAGYTYSFGAGQGDACLIKTNALGDTLWTRTYGGATDDWANYVLQTPDSGYIITGCSGYHGARGGDVWLIKTNARGDTLWTRTFGGDSLDVGCTVQPTSDGGYIIAGGTRSFGRGGLDIYLIKTNASGDTLWTRTYGGTADDGGSGAVQTNDGGYTIAGYTYSFGAGQSDVYLIRTDSSGDTLWTRTYGDTGDDGASSVERTSDGGCIVAGYTSSFGAGSYDFYLIKADANGYASVAEPAVSREQNAATRMVAVPNPFVSSARIPGHDGEQFEVYDASGKMVGTYRGNRIGEGLLPAVYFIKPCDAHGGSLRVVKAR